MGKTDIFKTLSHYKDVLEEQGYTVLYIGLYGSQNYNLDDEQSDIDCKVIILPTLHDIIFRNGYRKDSPKIKCLCDLSQGFGKEKWGAEPGKSYYIIEILNVEEVK